MMSIMGLFRTARTQQWVVVTILGVLLSACATTAPTPSEEGSNLAAFKEQASEQQRPYFDDGVIEFAEYEEAVFATVACVEARGFSAEANLAEDGFYQYSLTLDDASDQTRMDGSIDDCRTEWSQQVELAFQSMQAPESDDLPALIATIECLRDAEEPPTGGTSAHQLLDFIEQLPDDSPGRACGELLPDP